MDAMGLPNLDELGSSSGCSLCISRPLFVLVMCFAFGTSLASFSCATKERLTQDEVERIQL
jgi:hypothetical protein